MNSSIVAPKLKTTQTFTSFFCRENDRIILKMLFAIFVYSVKFSYMKLSAQPDFQNVLRNEIENVLEFSTKGCVIKCSSLRHDFRTETSCDLILSLSLILLRSIQILTFFRKLQECKDLQAVKACQGLKDKKETVDHQDHGAPRVLSMSVEKQTA